VLHDTYAALGRPAGWRQRVFATGHQETPAMRSEVLQALERLMDGN
jgi:hypothetical protein